MPRNRVFFIQNTAGICVCNCTAIFLYPDVAPLFPLSSCAFKTATPVCGKDNHGILQRHLRCACSFSLLSFNPRWVPVHLNFASAMVIFNNFLDTIFYHWGIFPNIWLGTTRSLYDLRQSWQDSWLDMAPLRLNGFTLNMKVHKILQHMTARIVKLKSWSKNILMALLPDMTNCGLRMRREYRELFPHHRRLAIPTHITARAWHTCRDACRDR